MMTVSLSSMEQETNTDAVFSDVIERIRNRCDQIDQSVRAFATDVLHEEGTDAWIDLYGSTVVMVLQAWRRHSDLDELLAGLQKQSLLSVYSYLCPAEERKHDQCNLLDPYKDVTKQLQELWSMKPRICSHCHKESIFAFVNAQTRSADEGMTTFVMCSLCGSRHRL